MRVWMMLGSSCAVYLCVMHKLGRTFTKHFGDNFQKPKRTLPLTIGIWQIAFLFMYGSDMSVSVLV